MPGGWLAITKHRTMSPPYLFAIESSGRTASAAVGSRSSDGQVTTLAEQTLPEGERTAKALIPAIRDLLATADVRPADLAAIAVTIGPGSFTGLRIGVTAAKTMAYAAGTAIVGVSTLDLLASQAGCPASGRVWAIVDAQRGDLFAGLYNAADWSELGNADRTQLMAGDQWLGRLAADDLVIGPAVERYCEQLPAGVRVACAEATKPTARALLQLGGELADRKLTSNPFELVPRYHRASAAEEKLN